MVLARLRAWPGTLLSCRAAELERISMVARSPECPGASGFVPESRKLSLLREAVQSCRGCGLYKRATQAVLGDGTARAKVMFIGETPGDEEDKQGKTFVGPAGRL